MTGKLKDIDYKKVFHFFEEISNVPRGSRNNKGISDYLVAFAKQRGLYYEQDELLNVVIIKEAKPGYEHCDAVMLQGHMDMVCLRAEGSTHDFEKDPLTLIIEGDFIRAENTTLGGDNGVAIAYALALLDSDDLVKQRLEVVITTDEEIGLIGATGLDTSSLKASYMINLDSEEESSILVGCAGGLTAVSELPLEQEAVNGVKVNVVIGGLLGGHSGIDCINNRTNATILMARLLTSIAKDVKFSLFEINSGEKDNAIPSLSKVSVVVAKDDVEKFVRRTSELTEVYKKEVQTSEPNLMIATDVSEESMYSCISKGSFDKIMMYILYQPNGIQTMSADIKGLVESSLNLGICRVVGQNALFSYSVRSSVASYKDFMSDKLEHFTKFLGGTYRKEGEYPAWEYKHESKLRDLCVEVYKEEFKREPIIETIHAGLECGILANKMPGLDIVSVGPDMFDVHTPSERLSISSAVREFDFITKLLDRLCE